MLNVEDANDEAIGVDEVKGTTRKGERKKV